MSCVAAVDQNEHEQRTVPSPKVGKEKRSTHVPSTPKNTETSEPTSVTLGQHDQPITCMDFSSDSTKLVSGDRCGTLKVWSVNSREQISSCQFGVNRVLCSGFSPDSKSVISGNTFGKIAHWQADTGKIIDVYNTMSDAVRAVEFHPSGLTFASANTDGKLRVWNTEDSSLENYRDLESGRLSDLEFSPDGELLAVCSETGRLYIFDSSTLEVIFTKRVFEEPLRSLCFSDDGQRLVLGGYFGSIRFMSLDDMILGEQQSILSSGQLIDVSMAADRLIAVESANGLLILNADASEVLMRRAGTKVFALSGNRKFYASDDDSNHVVLWYGTQPQRVIYADQEEISALEYTQDGRYLISGGEDGSICFWDPSFLTLQRRIFVTCTSVSALVISNDGRHVAVAIRGTNDDREDAWVYIYEVDTGYKTAWFSTDSDTIYGLAYSHADQYVHIVGSDFLGTYSTVRRMFSKKRVRNFGAFWDTCYSNDGRYRLTVGGDVQFRLVRDPHTVDERRYPSDWFGTSCKWHNPYSARFHPSSAYFAVGGKHGLIRVVDVGDLTLATKFASKYGRVEVVRFSQNGNFLASCGEGVVELWDPFSGMNYYSEFLHKGQVNDVSFHPTKGQLASAGEDGRIVIRDIASILDD
ncbi:MAG: WD40 repeat domain-containing protein [Planctomycetota bacterium]